MNYEKAYKEALERAKSAIKECGDNKGRITMIESIFPELAESEDEKIRKELIEYLKDYPNLPNGYYCLNDFFAWLEKQGERNNIVEQLTAFAVHLNKRGAFRDDLCMDFEHEAQSFIESQNHEKYENHETIKITKL